MHYSSVFDNTGVVGKLYIMPVCKNCKESFPTWVKIDGKKRNLTHRKYCFKCSPWGSHNTRPLITDIDGVIKTLSEANEGTYACKCGKLYEYNRELGHNATACNSCKANERRYELKIKAVEYKGGCCQRCGYNKNKTALQFHHLDPSQKDFGLGGHHGRSWKSIKAELDKCVCLCANCHSEVHDEQLQEARQEALKRIIETVKSNPKIKPSQLLREHPLWEL